MYRVSEFAKLKGISRDRAYKLVTSGALPHQTLNDGTILLEDAALLWEPRSARPLSERMAWLLLRTLSGEPATGYSPSERTRVERYVQEISQHENPAKSLAEKVSRRSTLHRFQASTGDLTDMREDTRVLVSGVGAPGSGMVAGNLLEGYMLPVDLEQVRGEYLLADNRHGNVLLRVSEYARVMPSVIAADLADWGLAREVREANTILTSLLERTC